MRFRSISTVTTLRHPEERLFGLDLEPARYQRGNFAVTCLERRLMSSREVLLFSTFLAAISYATKQNWTKI